MSVDDLENKLSEAMGEPSAGGSRSRADTDQYRDRAAMLKRLRRVLTRTEEGNSRRIEGTPFTEVGVLQLSTKLRERSAQPDAKGARFAAKALEFLSPAEGEESFEGISVPKLQMIARRHEKMGSIRKGLSK